MGSFSLHPRRGGPSEPPEVTTASLHPRHVNLVEQREQETENVERAEGLAAQPTSRLFEQAAQLGQPMIQPERPPTYRAKPPSLETKKERLLRKSREVFETAHEYYKPSPETSILKRVGMGAARVGVGLGEMPFAAAEALATEPQTPEEAAIEAGAGRGARGRVALTTKRMLYDPQAEMARKARELAEQGRTAESLGYSVAAGVPLLGPMAAATGETIGAGDVAGGLTEAALLFGPSMYRTGRGLGRAAWRRTPPPEPTVTAEGVALRELPPEFRAGAYMGMGEESFAPRRLTPRQLRGEPAIQPEPMVQLEPAAGQPVAPAYRPPSVQDLEFRIRREAERARAGAEALPEARVAPETIEGLAQSLARTVREEVAVAKPRMTPEGVPFARQPSEAQITRGVAEPPRVGGYRGEPGGLGRGLGRAAEVGPGGAAEAPALFAAGEPTRAPGAIGAYEAIETGQVVRVPLGDVDVIPAKYQLRKQLNEPRVEAIRRNMEQRGAFGDEEPVDLWLNPETGRLELLSGHHRFEAAKRAGLGSATARILTDLTPQQAVDYARRANAKAGVYKPTEEAEGFRAEREKGLTTEQIAQEWGGVRASYVENRLALNNLPPDLKLRVDDGTLSPELAAVMGKAVEKHGLAPETMSEVFDKVVKQFEMTPAELTRMLDTLAPQAKKQLTMGLGFELPTGFVEPLQKYIQTIRELNLSQRRLKAYVAEIERMEKRGEQVSAEELLAKDTAARRVSLLKEQVRQMERDIGRGRAPETLEEARRGEVRVIPEWQTAKERVEYEAAIVEGQRAAQEGADWRVNPYVDGTSGSRGWLEGFTQGGGRIGAKVESRIVSEKTRPGATEPEVSTERVLPGMEEAVATERQAVMRQQGERLAEEMGRPPESIEEQAGRVERESPLFRGTEASPQREMFEPQIKPEGLPKEGEPVLQANPVFNPRLWQRLDRAIAEKVTRPLAAKLEQAIGKLPNNVQRFLRSEFGRFPEIRTIFQEARRQVGALRSEGEALARMWLRTKPTPEESFAAEHILRGRPQDLVESRLRPEQQAVLDEIREAAQRLTAERQALGLPVREEWLEGPAHWYPNFFRQRIGQWLAGRLYARTGGKMKPGQHALGSLKPRLSDRYWVADSSGKVVEQSPGVKAIFRTREEAEAFVQKRAGYWVNFFEVGEPKMQQAVFPTLRERTEWLKENSEDLTIRGMGHQSYQVVEPMTLEQQIGHGLLIDPSLNLRLGWSQQAELVGKTRFLAKLGEMEGVVSDTPKPGYVSLTEAGFSIPKALADRNPAVARLRDGYVYEPLAHELAGLYGPKSPFLVAYRVAEGALRRWATYRNPFRHPRQIFENELMTALTDMGAFLDKPAQVRAFRDYARAATGRPDVPYWQEFLSTDLPATDIVRGELQTMWRGLSRAIHLEPNAPLSLTERLALWAEENPAARKLLASDRFAQELYHAEDQVYKYYRFRRYREQGWTVKEAAKRTQDSYFDFENVPIGVRAANRVVPFLPNVAYQFTRIFANQLRDNPIAFTMRVGLLAGGYYLLRESMVAASGLTERDLEAMGKMAPKTYEIVLPWTDERGRNLSVNLQWLIPYADVALIRETALEAQPTKSISQTARRFIPMVAQPAATLLTGRVATGREVFTGAETRTQALRKLAYAASVESLPMLLGQYWASLYRNATAGERAKRPLSERGLVGPLVGGVRHFYPEETVSLRRAQTEGQLRAIDEDLGKLRGRFIRGQISESEHAQRVRDLARSVEESAHPETLAVVEALEAGQNEQAQKLYQGLKASGYYSTSEDALQAVRELLNRKRRLSQEQTVPLAEARRAAEEVLAEFREAGRASAMTRQRLEAVLDRLPESDQKALMDWLDEQVRMFRRIGQHRPGTNAEPRVQPESLVRPRPEAFVPAYQ